MIETLNLQSLEHHRSYTAGELSLAVSAYTYTASNNAPCMQGLAMWD